jgi:hypothetical protein
MTVSGHRYELDSRGVQAALEGVLPEPIHEHFVVMAAASSPKEVVAWPAQHVFAKGPGCRIAQVRGDLHGRWRQATPGGYLACLVGCG